MVPMEPEILTTRRLRLRKLEAADADALAMVLCDPVAMRWYPRPYSHVEVDDWIARNRARYDADRLRSVGRRMDRGWQLVGDCGLVMQSLEETRVLEVGYHVLPAWQRRGIATAAALACRDYARDVLQVGKLYAFVRPENEASRRVAATLGMRVEKSLVRGAGDFLHEIWAMELR